MIEPFKQIGILAQRSRWERLGDRFHGRPRIDWGEFVIWIVLLAAFGIVLYFLARFAKRIEIPRASRHPKTLFHELCRAHGFDRAARRLLTRLAEAHQMPMAATLFVEPARFDPKQLPDSMRSDAAKIDALRVQLFEVSRGQASAPNAAGTSKSR